MFDIELSLQNFVTALSISDIFPITLSAAERVPVRIPERDLPSADPPSDTHPLLGIGAGKQRC